MDKQRRVIGRWYTLILSTFPLRGNIIQFLFEEESMARFSLRRMRGGAHPYSWKPFPLAPQKQNNFIPCRSSEFFGPTCAGFTFSQQHSQQLLCFAPRTASHDPYQFKSRKLGFEPVSRIWVAQLRCKPSVENNKSSHLFQFLALL